MQPRANPLAHERLPIVSWLGGRVDAVEAGVQRRVHEVFGRVFFPRGAVDEGRRRCGAPGG